VHVDAEPLDLGFERLARHTELGRRARWTGDPAAALRQRTFDHLFFPAEQHAGKRHRRPARAGRITLEPRLVYRESIAIAQNYRPLDDVLQLANIAGSTVGLKNLQRLLVDAFEFLAGCFAIALDKILDE